MGKKIIVAGGGHGGIAAGMLLAKKGFDVTVYEKNSRENMGHDWTDIFDKKGFTAIGLELPDKSLWKLKHDMTFYGPAYETALELKALLEREGIANDGENKNFENPYEFFVSDLADKFKTFANSILPCDVTSIKKINIEEY